MGIWNWSRSLDSRWISWASPPGGSRPLHCSRSATVGLRCPAGALACAGQHLRRRVSPVVVYAHRVQLVQLFVPNVAAADAHPKSPQVLATRWAPHRPRGPVRGVFVKPVCRPRGDECRHRASQCSAARDCSNACVSGGSPSPWLCIRRWPRCRCRLGALIQSSHENPFRWIVACSGQIDAHDAVFASDGAAPG